MLYSVIFVLYLEERRGRGRIEKKEIVNCENERRGENREEEEVDFKKSVPITDFTGTMDTGS